MSHELANLARLYELIEHLHALDPHPLLSMYKACTSETCKGLTLVDMARQQDAQIFQIEDISELKPILGRRPGVGVIVDGQCDLFILFKGEASFNPDQ